MQTAKIDVQCTFVACGQKEGKKVWVRLSDGIEPAFFSTDLPLADFADLNRGDEVNVDIEVNPFSKFGTKIISIQ